MSNNVEKQELFNNIWKMADDLRGKLDGWDFKDYILGFMFYKFLSDSIVKYINDNEHEYGSLQFNYAELSDEYVNSKIRKKDIINEKGFFIKPSELFSNVYKKYKNNSDGLNIELKTCFKNIENSAREGEGKNNFIGLFDLINLENLNKLGDNLKDRNQLLLKIMQNINDWKISHPIDSENDIFGDAYEFLISKYSSNAGKSGGEFYTPQCVSKLLTHLVVKSSQNKLIAYDPACGSGSLLLQLAKNKDIKNIEFYGQESNPITYNLCRINMFLHNVNFDKFDIHKGDTLINPSNKHMEMKFDVIVSNPPYSVKWDNSDNRLNDDPRYSPAGVLAPSSKGDFAFIMHAIYLLKQSGRAAIVCFPGIFYRPGAEQKIRKYLVDENYIDCIIALPKNLFYGTSIETTILVLSKSKCNDTGILFINAQELYVKKTNQNELDDDNIRNIVSIFNSRKDIDNLSKLVNQKTIVENNYDLSVNKYVKLVNNEEEIDIVKLNNEINEISAKNIELRKEINDIIREIDD